MEPATPNKNSYPIDGKVLGQIAQWNLDYAVLSYRVSVPFQPAPVLPICAWDGVQVPVGEERPI